MAGGRLVTHLCLLVGAQECPRPWAVPSSDQRRLHHGLASSMAVPSLRCLTKPLQPPEVWKQWEPSVVYVILLFVGVKKNLGKADSEQLGEHIPIGSTWGCS